VQVVLAGGIHIPAGPKKVPKNELENDPKIDSPKKGSKSHLEASSQGGTGTQMV
jgi:hypothetical protein